MLSDISNINNHYDLIYITTAVILIDLIVIIIAKKNLLGKQINIWYDKFGMTAVLLDVTIIIIVLIITRYIFSIYNIKFSPEYFIVVSLIVQLIHDILLYKLIIEPTPKGVNQIIDVYKDYAVEGGTNILLADSAMVFGSGLIAMYLKSQEFETTTTILITSLYIIPYLIYTK
jgi:hypothetical protein